MTASLLPSFARSTGDGSGVRRGPWAVLRVQVENGVRKWGQMSRFLPPPRLATRAQESARQFSPSGPPPERRFPSLLSGVQTRATATATANRNAATTEMGHFDAIAISSGCSSVLAEAQALLPMVPLKRSAARCLPASLPSATQPSAPRTPRCAQAHPLPNSPTHALSLVSGGRRRA